MRTYRSPRRDAGAAATREALLAAFAAQLSVPGAVDADVPAAAAAAGVAVRTAYHHFPDRARRLTAVAAWVEESLGLLPPIDGVDDLPDHVRRTHHRAGRRLDLTRALAAAAPADDARTRRLRARHLEIAALLTGLGAPSAPTSRATAVVAALAAPEASLVLVDVHGLSMEEAGEAAAQAVGAVIADLRARRRAMIGA